MANIEKHPKQAMEQIDQNDSTAVVASAGASHLHQPNGEDRPFPFILRFEDLPASPENVERMGERVRGLNRHLAESGAPFRFRLV